LIENSAKNLFFRQHYTYSCLATYRHPLLYYIWFQISAKSLLNKLKPDLFLSHDGLIPLGAHCKKLPVICDINFYHYPKALPFAYRLFLTTTFQNTREKRIKLLRYLSFVKMIFDRYDVPQSKIDVVHLGADEHYMPIDEQTKERCGHNLLMQGVLYICRINTPRKNIIRLLQAFDIFKKSLKVITN